MKSILGFIAFFLFSVASFAETDFQVDETQKFLEKSFPKKLELLNQSHIQTADLTKLLNTLKLYFSLTANEDRVPAQLSLGLLAGQIQDLLQAQSGETIVTSDGWQNTTTPQGNLFSVFTLVCVKKLRPFEMRALVKDLQADSLAILESTQSSCGRHLAPSLADPRHLEILKAVTQFFKTHLQQQKLLPLI